MKKAETKNKLSPEDIAYAKTQYRDANDKTQKLYILTDELCCDSNVICEAIGVQSPCATIKYIGRAPRAKNTDQATRMAAVREVLLDGKPHLEVAEKYGVKLPTLCSWIAQARKTQQEFLSYKPKTKPKRRQGGAKADQETKIGPTATGWEPLMPDKVTSAPVAEPENLTPTAEPAEAAKPDEIATPAIPAMNPIEAEFNAKREAISGLDIFFAEFGEVLGDEPKAAMARWHDQANAYLHGMAAVIKKLGGEI